MAKLPTRRIKSAVTADFSWADWKQILLRVKDELGRDNVGLIAAGVAFYAMLALFPSIAAFVGAYGLIADPAEIEGHLAVLESVAPPDAYAIIAAQVQDLAASGRTQLGFASALAILLSLWSARSGVNALVTGLNIVYDETERRGFFSKTFVTLTLTTVLFAVAAVAVFTILAVPALLDFFEFGAIAEWAAATVRWPIVVAAVIAGLAILYRFGPNRKAARMIWMSWGATFATLLWIVGSAGFSIYVANFASYNETYGSLGAVVGMLMWFYLSAYIVLLGAEINAEMERQRRGRQTAAAPRREDMSTGVVAS